MQDCMKLKNENCSSVSKGTALLLFVCLTSSCSTVVKLPAATDNTEAVYLLKYSTWGHHSLAFYDDGRLTEFTYGDWELFALNKRDSWTAWKNMTFPTGGALGRKSIEIKSGEPICERFTGCEAVVFFDAPGDKVNQLKNLLEREYIDGLESEVFNEAEDVFFVKHRDPYWGFHNCNHELVEWLEALGAEISGRVFYKPAFFEGMIPKQQTLTLLP
jgi:hypothetical protein